MSDTYQARTIAALKNAFVGDALAMPVHWYYKPADIYKAFKGGIQQFEDAPSFHPSSIMSLHSTSKGGRAAAAGQDQKQIVGEVILKGRQQYWTGANQHYHQGMKAGENTLNAHCARVLLRCLAQDYDQQQFLQRYIDFMCAEPPPHPDTYAESYHRGFFANLMAGKPADKCGAVTHDTPSVGGLVAIAPLVLISALSQSTLQQTQRLARSHLALTHPSEELATIADYYVELVYRLLQPGDESSKEILADIGQRSAGVPLAKLVAKQKSDIEVVGQQYSSACYISDAWPSVLYFAYRYADDSRQALIANTNVGGDNVHRGFVLGTIMGLIHARPVDALFDKLRDAAAIGDEIHAACQHHHDS